MEPTERERLAGRELASELKAAVLARRELDPDMEDHLIEAFLARIELRVDSQVSRQLEEFKSSLPVKDKKKAKTGPDTTVIFGTLALAIPLMAIAANVAGPFGVFLVMTGVVAVILLYFIDRWATK